ncbi:MAG: hypothetical protein M1820_005816 [Bogoriella megaspora]|nr:MAG: hypothetical protein M1820_005816 [Bogoriella megaspora]
MFPAIALLAVLIAQYGKAEAKFYNTRFEGVTWDDDNWRITTTNLDQGHYQSRMSLSNGYFGINVAAVGPFFEADIPADGDNINGWPLFNRRQTFSTIAGFYDLQPTTNGSNYPWLNQLGGESVISGLPHWSGLAVSLNGHILNASVDPSEISKFSSTLDIGAGTLSWQYTWTPDGEVPIDIEYTFFVHKLYVNQAVVQLGLTAARDVNVTVLDVFQGDAAVRTSFVDKAAEPKSQTIWSAVRPNGIGNVTAYVYSQLVSDGCTDESDWARIDDPQIIGRNQSGIGQSLNVSLKAGQTSTFGKFVGAASSDAFEDPQDVARNASVSAASEGYQNLLEAQIREWASILTEDSVDSFRYAENGTLPEDENIVELQITAVTNPFHLLQNTVGPNAIAEAGNNPHLGVDSIAVGGLGSDSYGGLIFWDADVWMAPGLVVAYPEAAKQIARYRLAKFPQAQRNIEEAYTSSANQTSRFSPGGAVYSWTSGRYGNCTGTGPCFDYEYHLNGDIGIQLLNYYLVSGDVDYFQQNLFPIYDAIALFYSELLLYNDTTGLYQINNATDPDEYANNVDVPGFTMPLVKLHLTNANSFRQQFGLQINQTWEDQISKIDIPVDSQADIILEYSTMNGSIAVKQADVILIDDFLDYPNSYSLNDLDYYAAKQSANGPGMTYGVFSIVANEFSPSGCSAYTYDLYGSQPYIRAPWFQFSEQLLDNFEANGGTHPAYPFLTGIGGANRVAVFGYLGLRLMNASLNIDPSLPPQIPRLDYRTIYWQGWPINATSNQTHTTLQRLSTKLSAANEAFADAPIPVTIGPAIQRNGGAPLQLQPGSSLTINNRQYSQNKTTANNLIQCQPVSSADSYEPGQFPLSAVDGAISTRWQPLYSNTSSSLTVHLLSNSFVPVIGFTFDWAFAPPESVSVSFSNSSSNASEVQVWSSDDIEISEPYDPSTAADIVPYVSNSTNVTLGAPVWSGRFATLVIKGSKIGEDNTMGATVAEWAIIAGEGTDNAGKTTLLYRLKIGEVVTTIPTIGFNVESVTYKNLNFNVWDLGGQTSIRPYWRCYYANTAAVIFVIDSTDLDRLSTASDELSAMLSEEELRDAALLVFANKQDQPGAKGAGEISEALKLGELRDRNWSIVACSAVDGRGVGEGMDWLVQTVQSEE